MHGCERECAGLMGYELEDVEKQLVGVECKSPHESDGPPLAVLLAAQVRDAAVTTQAVVGMSVILAAAFVGRRMS